MDSEFPSNSQNARPSSGEKKIERVIDGPVTRRKAPLGKRFSQLFVAGDSKTVGQYVVLEVLLPAAKDMVADAVTTGIERMIFGEVRTPGRRGIAAPRSSGPGGYISYNRYGAGAIGGPPRDGDRRPPMTRQARATHAFDEIVLDTRHEAEEVIASLLDMIQRYEAVSVSDLYEMIGEKPSFTDEKWGWTNLEGARPIRTRGGFLLDLPRPIELD